MRESFPPWRFLLLFVVSVAFAGCASWSDLDTEMTPAQEMPTAADCENNVPDSDPKKPEVCIRKYKNLIETNPPRVNAWRRSNGQAVKITWTAAPQATAKLKISFLQSGCVKKLSCRDNQCTAKTDTRTRGHYECEYVVELNGSTTDPLVIIDD